MTYFPQKKTYDYDEPDAGKGVLPYAPTIRVIGFAVLAAALIACGFWYFLFVRHVPFSVRADVSPGTALIGDTVRCDITVTADRDAEYELMVPEKVFSGFTVRGTDFFEGSFLRKKTLKKTYLLTRYSPGEAEVGQVEARAREEGATGWKTARTAPVGVTFRPLLSEERVPGRKTVIEGKYFTGGAKGMGTMPGVGDEEGGGAGPAVDGPVRFFIKDKADPKSVRTIGDMGLAGLAIVVGGVLALLLALVIYGTIKAAKEKPAPLAHETALARLAKLSARTRDEKQGAGRKAQGEKNGVIARSPGEMDAATKRSRSSDSEKNRVKEKDLYAGLYAAMTDYVKAAFGLGTGNLTAKEFITLTGVLTALSNDQKEYLKKMATLCDLIKYSGYQPQSEELSGEIKAGIEFVEATKKKDEGRGTRDGIGN